MFKYLDPLVITQTRQKQK